MAFRIVWSGIAVEDLREIVRYIGLDNAPAAAELAERILCRIERAAEFPVSNRIVPERGDESLREIVFRPYRVIYEVDDKRGVVHVLRIWHAARGTPNI